MAGAWIKDKDLKEIRKALRIAQGKRNNAETRAKKMSGPPGPSHARDTLFYLKNLRMIQREINNELADSLEEHAKKLRAELKD